MPAGVSTRKFMGDLWSEISDDNVFNGAAALAYYMMLAIFPAAIFLLSVIPYIPVANLERAIFDFLRQGLPPDSFKMVSGILQSVTQNANGGLLSFGLLFTIWSASSGLYAIMQQLNITYDVKESRPFWKARGTALLLTVVFAALVVGAFALIVFGGVVQEWLGSMFGLGPVILTTFAVLRWVIIGALLLLGFALVYYFGPDVKQKFSFITPGSVAGVALLVAGSIGFKLYVDNFASYDKTYGSLGAVIILLLWLYLAGLVLLLGSEVNALIEHYHPRGKEKGERDEGVPHERGKRDVA